jgi:small subunit ribosomal protein S18
MQGAHVTNEGETASAGGPPRADRPDRGDRGGGGGFDRGDRGGGGFDRGDRGDRGGRGGGGGGGRRPRRRGCEFCGDDARPVDYKDTTMLARYLTDRAKMDDRKKGGACAKHQRAIATAVKRARFLALLPYTFEHMRISGVNPARR